MLARRFATRVLLLALVIPGPAFAATDDGNVTVGFDLSLNLLAGGAGVHHPTPYTYDACQLSVPSGSNGYDVLNAAVSQRCITSYSATLDRVTCIDEVCARTYQPIECPIGLCGFGVKGDWDTSCLTGFRASEGGVFWASYWLFTGTRHADLYC